MTEEERLRLEKLRYAHGDYHELLSLIDKVNDERACWVTDKILGSKHDFSIMDDALLDESSGIYLDNGFYAQEANINGCTVIYSLEQRIYYFFSIHQRNN